MVKKTLKATPHEKASKSKAKSKAATRSQSVIDSAQQVWAAGRDVLAMSKSERAKAFATLQKKAQSAVVEKANEVGSRAGEQWDKLEAIFETRVASALKRLGVPSGVEFASVSKKLEALAQAVGLKKAAVKPARKTAAKAVTKVVTKAVAKPAAKTVAKPVDKKVVAKKVAAAKPVAKKAVVAKPAAKPALKRAAKQAGRQAVKAAPVMPTAA